MNARQLILNLVIVVVLLAIGGGIAYESYQSNNYVGTDNAQVTMPVVDVATLAAGTVKSLPVAVGQKVSAGQTLAQIATGAAAATTTATTGKTAGKGTSTAGLTNVTAPVAGVISVVSVAGGQTVMPGQTLVEVSDPGTAVVVANIPETSIRNVADGQSVDVTIDAYPGTTFKGHVEAIQPATQASLSLFPSSALSGSFTQVTQLVPVWIAFDSQGDVLYNGLSASVSIHTGNGSL
jgi:multidrug resistance efflux pump